jgi:hypothetical protein
MGLRFVLRNVSSVMTGFNVNCRVFKENSEHSFVRGAFLSQPYVKESRSRPL